MNSHWGGRLENINKGGEKLSTLIKVIYLAADTEGASTSRK